MKKLLFITLIILASSYTDDVNKTGPAYNIKNEAADYSCDDKSYLSGSEDGSEGALTPGGVSDCVDLLLWSPSKNKYYDRCCYVRYQLQGEMFAECVGLTEEEYLDTTVTIDRMENGDRRIWSTSRANSKIYQLDCISSYLKSLSFTSILLLALFF